jgi:2-oxoisovalerate dehydrogenase E1 component
LKTQPDLMLFGEDIEDGKGGVFGMTKGLSSTYPGRVVNSPLAEATVMGVGAGLAIAGMRPIVELQFIDFVGPAFNQLVNQVATLRWRSMGAWTCPLTIIAPCGAYLPSGGPWHSQSNESWFLHVPGLRVAMPSTASDAAGFLRAAIAGDDPVLLLIPKHLFRARFDLAASDTVCFGKAAIRREGDDVTIVTWGNGTEICLEAAQSAAAKGINARIIDLRSLSPYDADAIERSVVQTGNLIVVNEDAETCNFGDTIVARLCANPSVFSRFKTRPIVISSANLPIGFNPALEAAVIPRVETVLHAIDEVCHVQPRTNNLRSRAAIG